MIDKNKFFTLLLEKCWHKSWEAAGERYVCDTCEEESKVRYNPAPLFPEIQAHMEKKLPRLLEGYLRKTDYLSFNSLHPFPFTKQFNDQLNLDNLYAFLKDHKEEWGWDRKTCILELENPNCPTTLTDENLYCKPYSEGKCKGILTKHPALIYMESEEGE